jgi:putative endonuclease
VDYNFYVYITTNPSKNVLYTGITNDLGQRLIEHYLDRGNSESFAGRYYAYLLIYWERHQYVDLAIKREKEIKGWSRAKKLALIHKENPNLNSLNASIVSPWPPPDGSKRGNR